MVFGGCEWKKRFSVDECDFENGVEGCFWENLKLRSYSCYALCKQVRSAIAVAVQMQD